MKYAGLHSTKSALGYAQPHMMPGDHCEVATRGLRHRPFQTPEVVALWTLRLREHANRAVAEKAIDTSGLPDDVKVLASEVNRTLSAMGVGK